MRNPNGYGSVIKLSGNRRRPYMARKTDGFDDRGHPKYKAIGYAATREEAMIMLAQFNNNPYDLDQAKITVGQLYDRWENHEMPKMAAQSGKALRSASKKLATVWGFRYRDLRAYHMQETIDASGAYSPQNKVKSLWSHLDRYALSLDIIPRMYSTLTTAAAAPDETTRRPFSESEISKLWECINTPWIDTILILIYTGFRLGEFLTLRSSDVDLEQHTIKGGIKTAAGRNRLVPIHPRIHPLIEARLQDGSEYLILHDGGAVDARRYYTHWYSALEPLGMKHIPHECRHTLRTRLDAVGANKRCIDLILGHKSKEVGERTYTHKTIEDLHNAIKLVT